MKLILALSQIKGKTETLQYRIQAVCTLDVKKKKKKERKNGKCSGLS